MTDSTIANLNDISSHGGVQGDDLFYVVRIGSPDLDFKGDADAIVTYVESTATAFATTGHTHVLADISDAGTLAGLNDIGTTQIQNDAVSYAKIQDVSAGDKILGRTTGSGIIEEITCTGAARDLLDDVSAGAMRTTLGLATVAATGSYADLSGTPALGSLAAKSSADLGTGDATGTLAASRFPALSGDVTTTAGAVSTTIAANAVTNAKAAQMAAATIKGNNGGSTANPSDLSASQVTAMLNTVAGDTGSGGTKGLVPAPASGDAASGKYLKADGAWSNPNIVALGAQTASYTLALSDACGVVTVSNASANTLTVPPNSSVAFAIGTQVAVYQIGAGQTTIAPGSGVTISTAAATLKLRAQYSGATLLKTGTNTWLLIGDLAAS